MKSIYKKTMTSKPSPPRNSALDEIISQKQLSTKNIGSCSPNKNPLKKASPIKMFT